MASPEVSGATMNEEENKEVEVSIIPVGSGEPELQLNEEDEVLEHKKEGETPNSKWRNFYQTYLSMLRMLMLKPVLIYIAFMFLQRVGFRLILCKCFLISLENLTVAAYLDKFFLWKKLVYIVMNSVWWMNARGRSNNMRATHDPNSHALFLLQILCIPP